MEPEKKTHTVWVGNLSEEMTEHILFSEFKHYGPICSVKLQQSRDGRRIGFINFYSKEVAEVAANDMDDANVCGVKIKTSFKNEEHKPKDIRPLTDCQNFMQKSCTKGSGCMFRHNESAKISSVDCPKWLARECMDISCNKRHPGAKAMKKKKTTATATGHTTSEQTDQVLKRADELPTHQTDQNWQVSQRKDASEKFVGVYWDIENCQLPSRIDPHGFVQKIRSRFLEGKTLVEFLCVCDNTNVSKSVIDGLSKEEVDVLHVSATAKNAADDKLKLRMQDFGFKNKKQAVLILISGDVNFAPVLHMLRYSLQVYVVLIHNRQASDQLTALADEKYVFDDFIGDIPSKLLPGTTNQILRTTELLVTNLPFEPSNEVMVRTRLSVLSDNCGGRVGQICRTDSANRASCVISFASADDAERAHRRMQGKDVCGMKILVEQYWGTDKLKSGTQDKGCGVSSPVAVKQKKQNRSTQENAYTKLLPDSTTQQQQHVRASLPALMKSEINYRANSESEPLKEPAIQKAQNPPKNTKMIKAASMNSLNFGRLKAVGTMETAVPGLVLQHVNALSDKVKFVLSDFPHWLSLERFASKFNEVYKEKFNLLELSKLDNIFIDGRPGRVYVCLRGSFVSQIPVNIDKADFHEKLVAVLKIHKRAVPVESIPGLMWSYNKKVFKHDPEGIPLNELLLNCPHVKQQKSRVFLSNPSYDASKNFGRFVAETEQILSFAKNRELPVDGFPAAYKKFFGTAIHGILGREQFTNGSANGTLEVLQRDGTCFVTISVSRRKEILGMDLQELLSKAANLWIPLASLPEKYFTYYGREILHSKKIGRLISLIKALNRKDFYIFKDNDKVLCVGLRKDAVQKAPEKSFIKFKNGLISLLQSKVSKKVSLETLEHEYNSFHGSCPLMKNLGFDNPNDLFDAMKPEIEVTKTENGFFIVLLENAQFSVWDYVLEAMLSSDEQMLLLSSLPQHIQDIKDSLLSSVPNFVTVLGAGESLCFLLNSKYEELIAYDEVTDICKILYESPGFKLSIQEVKDKLSWDNAKFLRTVQLGLDSARISVEDSTIFSLNQDAACRYFQFEATSLLYERPENSCTLAEFCGLYHKKFGKQYKKADFGLKKAIDIFNAIGPEMIEVSSSDDNSTVLSLTLTGKFIENAKKLLINNNGLVFKEDLAKVYTRILDSISSLDPSLYYMPMPLESKPELFAVFDLKTSTATYHLVLLKHFYTSLNTGVNEGMKHAAGDAKPSAAPPSLQKPSAAHESIQKLSAAYPSLQKPSVTPQSLQKPFATPPILQKPPAALSSLQDLIKQNNDLIARVSNLGKTSSDDGHVGAENKGTAEKKRPRKKKGKRSNIKPVPTIDTNSEAAVSTPDARQVNDDTDSSDDASVIIESEELVNLGEFSDNAVNSESVSEIDLLDFGGAESESDRDWWLQGVPSHLPSPAIRPEPVMLGNSHTVGDLISLDDDSSESKADSGNGGNISSRTDDELLGDLRSLKLE